MIENVTIEPDSELEKPLSSISAKILKDYTNLKITEHSDHILISPIDFLGTDLAFLPMFHCILSTFNKESFKIQLIAFNAKVLEVENVSYEDQDWHSILLDDLNSNAYKLCPGLAGNFGDEHVNVREHVKEKLVSRHKNCAYVVRDSPSCSSCSKKFSDPPNISIKREWESCSSSMTATVIPFTNHSDILHSLKSYGFVAEERNSGLKFSFKKDNDAWSDDYNLDYQPPSPSVDPMLKVETEYISNVENSVFSDGTLVKISRMPKKKMEDKLCVNCGKKFSKTLTYERHVDMCLKKKTKLSKLNKVKGDLSDYMDRGDKGVFSDGQHVNVGRLSQAVMQDLCCPYCHKHFAKTLNYEKHLELCMNKKVKVPKERSVFSKECTLCLRDFTSESLFRKHMAFHEERHKGMLNVPVNCPSCKEKMDNAFEVNPHYQSKHEPDKGVCIQCFDIFPAQQIRRHLYKHYYDEKNHLCSTCGESFATNQKLEIHYASKHDSSKTSVVCDDCGKVYPHWQKLRAHKNLYHTGRIYECHSCDKKFNLSMSYYKHVKIHSYTKPYRCKICGYQQVSKWNVRMHLMKVHKLSREDAWDYLLKVGTHKYAVLEKRAELEKLAKEASGENSVSQKNVLAD